jgi:transcriptional accessory protein Tex/SPT6
VKLGDIVKVKVLEVSAARKPIAGQRFNDGQMTSRGPAKQDNGGGAFAEAMHRAVDGERPGVDGTGETSHDETDIGFEFRRQFTRDDNPAKR